MSWSFEVIAHFAYLIEGPAWDGQALLFTELHTSTIHRFDPTTSAVGVHRTDTNNANGTVFGADGKLYACEGGVYGLPTQNGRRIVRYDNGQTTVIADRYEGRRFNGPNDLALDTQGRVWFTDPRYGARDDVEIDHDSVYRADPTGPDTWSVTRVTFDTTRPNGVLVSPDQRMLYVAQTDYGEGGLRALWAYPIGPDGALGAREVLHDFYPHRSIDGMCLDVDGNIVATAGSRESGPGPMIYVFSPTGRILEAHPLPDGVDRPTNCSWGGADLRTLYVTTATGHLLRTHTDRTGWLLYPSLG